MIKYVFISSYKLSYQETSLLNDYEDRKEYYKNINSNDIKITSIENYENLIKSNIKNLKYSLLEVIPEDKVNIFFDIDNVMDKNIIFKLIIDIMNFFGFINQPTITIQYNLNKYSYHLIFPYYTNLMYLKHLISVFLNFHREYINIIDISVYTPYFLFRSVYSYKPSKFNKSRKNNKYHTILYTFNNGNKDDIKKTLIQYTSESEYYKPRLIISNYKQLYKNKLNDHYNKIIQQKDKEYNELINIFVKRIYMLDKQYKNKYDILGYLLILLLLIIIILIIMYYYK